MLEVLSNSRLLEEIPNPTINEPLPVICPPTNASPALPMVPGAGALKKSNPTAPSEMLLDSFIPPLMRALSASVDPACPGVTVIGLANVPPLSRQESSA